MQWPLRTALMLGGIVLATPGGGLMPLSNLQMELLGLAILAPALALAWVLGQRFKTRSALPKA
jgi:membrane protein implicated in regulation of membrane protease activity